MEEKVTTFDSFIENLCKQYKDNEKKMRELILSIRKFKLLQKYGYIRLFSPMDSDDVLAAGLKDFEFGLYPRRDRSLHFNGDDYFFRQLVKGLPGTGSDDPEYLEAVYLIGKAWDDQYLAS